MGTLRYMLKENASKVVSDPKALSNVLGGFWHGSWGSCSTLAWLRSCSFQTCVLIS